LSLNGGRDSRHSPGMLFGRQATKLLDPTRFTWGQPTPPPTPHPPPLSVLAATPRPAPVTGRSKRRVVRLYQTSLPTLEDHARELLAQAAEMTCGGCDVLACDLQRIYPEVCGARGWAPRAWNSVARELRRLTGGRKAYAWVEGERLRVYRIPKRLAA
jgi:hypothetical protein